MYSRRHKIIVAILKKFGFSIQNLDMQKLLFLLVKEFNLPIYEFVPYKYGCFSFQSYADRRRLINDKILIADENNWSLQNQNISPEFQLSFEDNHKINILHERYASLKGTALIRHVYLKYPYYAIKSEILQEILKDPIELEQIKKSCPKNEHIILYTIGYEGKSLERFINSLIMEDVKILCDVRKKPLSMKYGFSKATLKISVESLGIEYIHIPELGIESDRRKNLKTNQDYINLFQEYEESLNRKIQHIHKIETTLAEKKRLALTCFEANPKLCHRTILAKYLCNYSKLAFKLKEL